MRKRIISLVMATLLALGITACGSSAPTNTPAGGGVESSVVEATAEPTEAPTPEPTAEPTPEPTATPEPTPEPTPFIMPEEPTVYIDGIEITLPCTWGEFSEKTGCGDMFDDSIYELFVDGTWGAYEADDTVYGIIQGSSSHYGYEHKDSNVSLPGDIHRGVKITKEELINLYGEPAKVVNGWPQYPGAPTVCDITWNLYGNESIRYFIALSETNIVEDVFLKVDLEGMSAQ